MSYLMLSAVAVCVALQNALKKQYHAGEGERFPLGFSLYACLGSFLLFAVLGAGEFSFSLKLLPYSVAFAASFVCAIMGSLLAMAYGSMAVAMLASSYSLVIPTLYGAIFLGDRPSPFNLFGLFLLLLSIYLVRRGKGERNGKKFLLCLLLSFFGNGLCSLVQKLQQLHFAGSCKNEFMLLSLLLSGVFLLLAMAGKGESPLKDTKRSVPMGLACGIAAGGMNYLVMVLTNRMPNVVLYPSISAGGLILGFFTAVLVFREKLEKHQYCGYTLGVFSIILLNL